MKKAILTVMNWKGGVGKTTTAAHLAYSLAAMGHRVLAIDADPQGHLATSLGVQGADSQFSDWLLSLERNVERYTLQVNQGLDLVPGNFRTVQAGNHLAASDPTYLQTMMAPLRRSGHRYVIIDTSPSAGTIQDMAVMAADALLIPVAVDFLSLQGLNDLIAHLRFLKESCNWQGYIAGILPTFYDDVTTESKGNLDYLQRKLGDLVLSPIHRATIFREAAAMGRTVFDISKTDSRPVTEYYNLAWAVKTLLNGGEGDG